MLIAGAIIVSSPSSSYKRELESLPSIYPDKVDVTVNSISGGVKVTVTFLSKRGRLVTQTATKSNLERKFTAGGYLLIKVFDRRLE